jgi:hypothetical protein
MYSRKWAIRAIDKIVNVSRTHIIRRWEHANVPVSLSGPATRIYVQGMLENARGASGGAISEPVVNVLDAVEAYGTKSLVSIGVF